jgi:pimeloyl-ACP methyl ester carboxylesterase
MENTHGDRIRELVFVDGAPGDSEDPELAAPAPARIFEPFLRCYVEHVLLTPAEVRNLLAGATVQHAFLTDEVVNEYLRRLRVEGLDRTIAGLFTVLGAQPVVPDFSSVTQRTLVLWGDQDSVFTLDSANRLVDRLPNAKLVVLENSGHIPMEEVPDAFTNALLEFLGGG